MQIEIENPKQMLSHVLLEDFDVVEKVAHTDEYIKIILFTIQFIRNHIWKYIKTGVLE